MEEFLYWYFGWDYFEASNLATKAKQDLSKSDEFIFKGAEIRMKKNEKNQF